MNVCLHCLRDNGSHTEFCADLRKRARSSNITHAIQYAACRATVSSYKFLIGEQDKHLIPMWDRSVIYWCDSISNMIERANNEGKIKDVFMADA